MGLVHLQLAVVVWLSLVGVVSAQFGDAIDNPGTLPNPVPPASTPRDGTVRTLDSYDLQGDSPGVYGWITRNAYAVFVWFIKPICVVITAFLDSIGFPSDPVTIDFLSGDVGWFLGVIDAWLPLHEAIQMVMSIVSFYFAWMPLRWAKRFFWF